MTINKTGLINQPTNEISSLIAKIWEPVAEELKLPFAVNLNDIKHFKKIISHSSIGYPLFDILWHFAIGTNYDIDKIRDDSTLKLKQIMKKSKIKNPVLISSIGSIDCETTLIGVAIGEQYLDNELENILKFKAICYYD